MALKHRTLSQDAEIREKIKSADLVNLLENHCFGLIDLKKGQVTAALGLLKKTLPDIMMVQVDVDGGIDINVLQVAAHPKPKRTVKPAAQKPDNASKPASK